jgi:membrane protease YdiL (CAAX protease family)
VWGYRLGFLFYWTLWCLLLPLLTVGPGELRQMFGAPQPRFGSPGWLGVVLLIGPVLSVLLTSFRSGIGSATLPVLIASVAHAVLNGTMEEVLWRGTYVSAFTTSWSWAVVYPSIWFGLWHLAPQAVNPYTGPGGRLGFAVMSVFLGLAWGWVAKSSGSIRWTVVGHIVLNAAALGGGAFLAQ